MKHLWIIVVLLGLVSCSEEKQEGIDLEQSKKQKVENLPVDQAIRRHVQNELDLTAADNYEMDQFSKDLNGDDVEDLIITVNLLDRALNEAIKSGKQEKAAELGYMGYYNYIFFMDGATNKISSGVVIPSSPMYHVKINFVNILGVGNSDFTVDYRVRNMQRRKFFTLEGGKPREICQAVIFDGLGTPRTEAYDIRYEPGTFNDYNDIVEFEATLNDTIIGRIEDTYAYEPRITPGTKEVRRWHYSPDVGKYYLIQMD